MLWGFDRLSECPDERGVRPETSWKTWFESRWFTSILKLQPCVQVSCFAVHENLNYMAIGYSSGVVMLLKGDITKERSVVNSFCAGFLWRCALCRNSSKQVVIHEGRTPVTGLSFRPTTTVKGGIVLFISSVDEVWSYMIGSRDKESEVSCASKMSSHLFCRVGFLVLHISACCDGGASTKKPILTVFGTEFLNRFLCKKFCRPINETSWDSVSHLLPCASCGRLLVIWWSLSAFFWFSHVLFGESLRISESSVATGCSHITFGN